MVVLLVFQGTAGINPEHQDVIKNAWIRLKEECPEILITVSGIHGPEFKRALEEVGILSYVEPTHATRAIGALAGFRRAFTGVRPPINVVTKKEKLPSTKLNEVEAMAILSDFGLPVVEETLVTTQEAIQAFTDFACPVVMKIVSADILHKSDTGAVKLCLSNESEVGDAFDEIMANAKRHHSDAAIDGCLVAPMSKQGVETILGVHNDPIFGPVVMFGMGGIFVESLKDVSFRVAPFDVSEARSMIGDIQASALLDGVCGQPAADVEALAKTLSDLSLFAVQHREQIESLDINPFVVRSQGEGGLALDAVLVTRPAE